MLMRVNTYVAFGIEKRFDEHVHVFTDGLRTGVPESDSGGQGHGDGVCGCRDFDSRTRINSANSALRKRH
jgi:hypothetical protein